MNEGESGFESSVDITESSTNSIQNIGNRSRVPHAIARDHRTRLLNVSPVTTTADRSKDVYTHSAKEDLH